MKLKRRFKFRHARSMWCYGAVVLWLMSMSPSNPIRNWETCGYTTFVTLPSRCLRVDWYQTRLGYWLQCFRPLFSWYIDDPAIHLLSLDCMTTEGGKLDESVLLLARRTDLGHWDRRSHRSWFTVETEKYVRMYVYREISRVLSVEEKTMMTTASWWMV